MKSGNRWAIPNSVLGEITIVVGGATSEGAATPEGVAARVAAAEQAGLTRKDAIASVAAGTGLRKREVYDAVIKAKGAGSA